MPGLPPLRGTDRWSLLIDRPVRMPPSRAKNIRMKKALPRCRPCIACAAGLAVLLVCFPSLAQAPAAAPVMDTLIEDIVASNLAPAIADHPGGFAAAAYVAGRIRFFNYGLADEATRQPITPDSLFNVASVRKLFEATLVALGTLRGELRLDDPVSKYVPELHGDYISRVTIGQLVTHTSGLLLPTDHPPWPNESYSLAEFIAMLNAFAPHAGEQPGGSGSIPMPATCCCSLRSSVAMGFRSAS